MTSFSLTRDILHRSEPPRHAPAVKMRSSQHVPVTAQRIIRRLKIHPEAFSQVAGAEQYRWQPFFKFKRLPSNNLVYNCLLFAGCATQVDTSGLDTLMPHQVCQQRYIIERLQEILSVPMAEGVRVHHLRINAPEMREALQLMPYGPWGKLLTPTI